MNSPFDISITRLCSSKSYLSSLKNPTIGLPGKEFAIPLATSFVIMLPFLLGSSPT
ncbi:hypothetical protein [Clostridium sp.]|uniref:hypothetical protein n=1 Tax=Clostridium sp. TaxID=1506 RepID=UPI0025C095F9|nr:hypothetical protein [Clostridium sp.]